MKRRLVCVLLITVLLCTAFTTPSSAINETNTALLSYLAGDVDGDWAVSTTDARVLLHAIVTQTTFPAAADANGDGTVNTSDASYILKASFDNVDPALIKPTVTYTETTPEGEEIAFVQANADRRYSDDSRRIEDVWVAQSLEELQASFADSNARADYSEQYTEEFFEDKAIIVWATHQCENGLVNMQMSRIVKNGNELCLVRNIELFLTMPMDWFDRYILEISKDDLVGIDTILLYTEYTYRE